MPRSKSAEKAARSGEKKRIRNRSVKSATKTYMSRAEKLIQSNDPEQAQAAVKRTITALDKAAQKRVIHPNTVSRRKSRLMKKLNKAVLSQAAEPETTGDTTEDTTEDTTGEEE